VEPEFDRLLRLSNPKVDADAGAADAGAGPVVCPGLSRPVKLSCTSLCIGGRPYDGFVLSPPTLPGLRGYFEQAARTEAASVHAFLHLAVDLKRLGAHGDLAEDCIAAAAEEASHAALMGHLAGAHIEEDPVPEMRPRSAFELALVNARAGLVEETFAAAVNALQARAASRPDVRRAFQVLSAEEAAHAALARRLHAFLVGRLTGEERAAVEAVRVAAILDLRRRVRSLAQAPVEELGLLGPGSMMQLLRGLEAEVFCVDAEAFAA
jgi:hypothetical protein